MNWIDIIIIIVLLYHIFVGWQRGFVGLLANLLSFLAAFWIAIRFHSVVGNFFIQKMGLPNTWTEVLGYVLLALISQILIEQLCLLALSRLPKRVLQSDVNKWLGSVLSFINGIILLAFILLLILALPLRGTIREDVRKSPLSQKIVKLAHAYGGSFTSSLDGLAKQAVKFLTIEPGSNERLALDLPTQALILSADPISESDMLKLLNYERASRGLSELSVDTQMRQVAREKAQDMFQKNYFSHYDLEGKSAADRFDSAHIEYGVVGENLAYAPDTESAHQGLMNSEGHRANILEASYRRIGIGVIDAGVYGKMYVQEFAD